MTAPILAVDGDKLPCGCGVECLSVDTLRYVESDKSVGMKEIGRRCLKSGMFWICRNHPDREIVKRTGLKET
jgi:hypothetical protein